MLIPANTLSSWPAVKDGRPVTVGALVTVHFRLL